MKVPIKGAVDCDLHPAPPSAEALLPYLDDYWRDQLIDRHIARECRSPGAVDNGSPSDYEVVHGRFPLDGLFLDAGTDARSAQ